MLMLVIFLSKTEMIIKLSKMGMIIRLPKVSKKIMAIKFPMKIMIKLPQKIVPIKRIAKSFRRKNLNSKNVN